jgi:glutamine synthetase
MPKTKKKSASRQPKVSAVPKASPPKASPQPKAKATTARTSGELVESLRERGVDRVKVGGFDIDGVLRGKYISLAKFASALESGFGFCDVIFGWDIADMLYDNATVTGWASGYPDALAVLDRDTLRMMPSEPGVASMLCDFRDVRGKPHPACPRSLLKRVVGRATDMGFEAKFGAEFEFFFFQETRDTLAAKGYRNLKPLDPGMFGYSWLRTGQDSELMRDIWQTTAAFGIELEALHTETGPGVYEAAIRYSDPVSIADQAALFKTTVKQVAHRHGISVTFMAKCDASLPGSSGHLHQSLWRDGKNAFYDARARHGMSPIMKSYVAGLIDVMQDWTALYSPTVNSYKRYVPGLWAPLVAAWGVENRTCAVRVVAPSEQKALRVEYRQTAADINPYIAIAATLGAGLRGVEKGLELPAEASGDAGTDGPYALPRTLADATRRLQKSRTAREVLGAAFVDHYVRTRDWEVREYQKAVSDWEVRRYFESI